YRAHHLGNFSGADQRYSDHHHASEETGGVGLGGRRCIIPATAGFFTGEKLCVPPGGRGISLAQLLDLLLHLVAKFQRMRHLAKRFGSSDFPNHHNRSITKHPAARRFAHFDALYFIQQHFDGLAAHQAGFDHHASVGHRHFCSVAPHHADQNHNGAANEQRRAASFREMQSVGIHFAVAESVVKQHRSGQTEQQESNEEVSHHYDPMQFRLINHFLARDQVRFYVAHLLSPSND